MAVAESLTVAVAKAAVQKALATWIADRGLADERRKQLRELLPKSLGDRIRRTAAAEQVAALVQHVDLELNQWVQAEMRALPDFERSAALVAVVDTFDRADLSDAALYADDLNADRLAGRLRIDCADVKASAQLSAAADALHDRALRLSCEHFLRLIQQIDVFVPRTLTVMLARFTLLEKQGRDMLRRLPEQPRRTEPEYWATVREIHGRTPELLGRETELADVMTFIAGPPGYRWLVGEAWAARPRCWRRRWPLCRPKWTRWRTSLLVEKPTPTATGSSLQSCLNWSTYSPKTRA